MSLKRSVFLVVLVSLLLMPIVSADIIDPWGIHTVSYRTSNMYLSVNYDSIPITPDIFYNNSFVSGNFYAEVLMCYEEIHSIQSMPELNISIFDSERNCYWTSSYMQYHACDSSNCNFLFRYPVSQKSLDSKLAIFLPAMNKTFISDSFILNSQNSYHVDILPNGTVEMIELAVDYVDTGSGDSGFDLIILPFVLTIVIELITTFLFLKAKKIKKKNKRILGFVALANLISWPMAFTISIFAIISTSAIIGFIIAELFVIVFEAYFLHWTNKKVLNLKQSFLMSILNNLASIIIGLTILYSIV